ncbi:MAG: chemotaxis protein CheW [Chloroflexi bacterium]|nr:chemotaxis protein CheW [Chloroflexota bacterium]
MRRDRAAIDWDEARARLDRARRAIELADDPAPAEVARILSERAVQLAVPVEEASVWEESLDILVFALGEERYAIETAHVLEVVPLGVLTPVPGTPAFVLGVVNHRGHVLSVLHLGRILELSGPEDSHAERVVAVEAGEMTFGLAADAVEGTLRLDARELGPALAAGERPTFLRGVTDDMVAVLDLEAFARDARILVNAEP